MTIDMTTLGQIIAISSVVFAIGLATMAKRRGLSVSGWAVLGLIPLVNFVSWIILLCIGEKSSKTAADA